MKKILPFLLVLSLVANAAWFFRKPANSIPAKFAATSSTADKSTAVDRSKLPADLAAALASGDPAALKAAGLSDEDVRAIGIGRAFAKFAAQMRSLRTSPSESEAKPWRNNFSRYNKMSAEQRTAMNKAQRDLAESMRVAFGDEAEFNPFGESRYKFLSAAKREEIRRIEQDYSEMQSEVYSQQEGITLSSDRAKLKLLQEEKERDIVAALSPEEREKYELYVSATGSAVRSRYGDAIQSEEDYKKIYALQKTFDQQYARENQARGQASSARTDAQRQLDENIRAIIGEDSFAAFQRANDSDLRALNSLQTRLNLPAGTSEQVYALRDTYAQRSQAINANSELTPAQRREQMNALAAQAKNDVAAKLGAEGGDAYAQRSPWLMVLKNGQAFSTNPKDARDGGFGGSTVYSLKPPSRAGTATPPVAEPGS